MNNLKTTAISSKEITIEMSIRPDLEILATQPPVTDPVSGHEETENDIFANAIRLPSESTGARTTQKSSGRKANGQVVIGSNPGRLVQLDSELEYKVALVLLAKPDFADLHDQVRFRWIDHTGKSCSHFFDFINISKSGERTGVIVKEASALKSERLQRKIGMISEQAVTGFVDRVIVVTQRDINPVDLHNAKLLHEVRHADPEADQVAEAVTSDLIGAATLADLTAMMKMGSRGFRALARLIRQQTLVLQNHEVVSYGSFVRRAV